MDILDHDGKEAPRAKGILGSMITSLNGMKKYLTLNVVVK